LLLCQNRIDLPSPGRQLRHYRVAPDFRDAGSITPAATNCRKKQNEGLPHRLLLVRTLILRNSAPYPVIKLDKKLLTRRLWPAQGRVDGCGNNERFNFQDLVPLPQKYATFLRWLMRKGCSHRQFSNILGSAATFVLMEVETLGVARNLGWKVHMRCADGYREGTRSMRRCVYRKQLDLETLVCTRGTEFPAFALKSRGLCVQFVEVGW
jgi:hypothetical protein